MQMMGTSSTGGVSALEVSRKGTISEFCSQLNEKLVHGKAGWERLQENLGHYRAFTQELSKSSATVLYL